MPLPGGGPLHLAISAFFAFLTISLFAQAILSWLPLRPTNPFVRFFTIVTGPILTPARRLVPSMTVGMFDVGYTIAFLVAWWALTVISFLMMSAMPAGW